jgi:hypothetical protein
MAGVGGGIGTGARMDVVTTVSDERVMRYVD